MEKKYKTKLTVNDLPEPYKTIAESCGIENAIKIAEIFGGSQVTFQKLDTILYIVKERLIKDEFNGYNYNELARRYNVSTSWIRKITTDLIQKERNRPLSNQLSIFPE